MRLNDLNTALELLCYYVVWPGHVNQSNELISHRGERADTAWSKNTLCWNPTHIPHKRAQKAIKLQHKTRRKRFHPHRAGWAPDSFWTEIGRRWVEKWRNKTFYNISPWRILLVCKSSLKWIKPAAACLTQLLFSGTLALLFRHHYCLVSAEAWSIFLCCSGFWKAPLRGRGGDRGSDPRRRLVRPGPPPRPTLAPYGPVSPCAPPVTLKTVWMVCVQ